MSKKSEMTPLMKQYWEMKSLHPDKILLFRMGDFFEMFHDDARVAAPILGIALTSRNRKAQDETPMCGVPHHSVAGPINKLLRCGWKVAICDQIEDARFAKGLVQRAITRILTPGMVFDLDQLPPLQDHYMACFDSQTLSCIDTSSGEAFYLRGERSELERYLRLLPIAELVFSSEEELKSWTGPALNKTHYREVEADPQTLPESSRRLLRYIRSLNREILPENLRTFEERSLQKRMQLSPTVLRHLEIFSTYRGDVEGSFFQAIDRTQTSAGTRRFRQWISFPLMDRSEIQKRQNDIHHWAQNLPRLKTLRERLSRMGDLERRLGKIAQPQCNARDLLTLGQSIEVGVGVLQSAGVPVPNGIEGLSLEISRVLVEDPPLQTRQGHLIRKGINSELDEWIQLSENAHGLLAEMEAREKSRTGISSLKIRYNNVFGYYIEITNTHKDRIPADYLRKQTLANAERFCTDELIELEKKVLSAQTRRAELEFSLFEDLRKKALGLSEAILTAAQRTSELDVLTSLSWLSVEMKLVRPEWSSDRLLLKASRHPGVERAVKKHFVANDIEIERGGCLLLTGPNMAGKSTLMRQVALTAIMAQMGSFVPATKAELPIFDSIYTRIGASDQLSEGLSTFMVEMTETAQMIQEATSNSLVILDEIGRGTSTFDGLALAQSILEFLVQKKSCWTFFATHYHELTTLTLPHLKNAHMSVIEKAGEIRFLHTLKSGPAQKSYGIQVGRLAGLPETLIDRATDLLMQHERQSRSGTKESLSSQLSLLDLKVEKDDNQVQLELTLQKIKDFEVSAVTPLEALVQISRWQEQLKTLN